MSLIKDVARQYAEYLAIKRILKIDKGTKQTCPKKQKIIFNRVYTQFSGTFYHEIGIAKALQLMGHDVLFLTCGGLMKNCTPVFTTRYQKTKKVCDNCVAFGKAILQACDIPYRTYTEILTGQEKIEPSFGIKKCVEDSTNRYFKGITNQNEKERLDTYSDRYQNALNSQLAGKLVYEQEKPDVIFSAHYGYAEWCPFYEYMQKRNVRYVVWDYIYGNTYMIFDMEKLGDMFDTRKHREPTPRDILDLTDYTEARKKGIVDTSNYKFDTSKILKRDTKYKHIFAIFPNLPWDTSLLNANTIFNSVYEWIDTTIEYFKKHQDKLLYIKIHPAEKIDNSYETVADYIKQKHELTENIRIIDVDDEVSAYNIYSIIDVGIVYNGTVGIEMSLDGIPVILAGNIYYANKGFTHEPKSVDTYLKYLDEPPKHLTTTEVGKAISFASFYFIKSRIPMLYTKRTKLGYKFAFESFNNLLEDKGIKKTVNYILNAESYQEKK